MRRFRCQLLGLPVVLALLIGVLELPWGWAQTVGDRVLLVDRAIGIPGHPAPGNRGVSHRFPGGTSVAVTDIHRATGWFEVEDESGNSAWITRDYIAQIVVGRPAPSGLCYRVGTWNLEHFRQGTTRGFPENTRGGPTYPARTPNDIVAIAAAIRDALGARILILNEINGAEPEGTRRTSPGRRSSTTS